MEGDEQHNAIVMSEFVVEVHRLAGDDFSENSMTDIVNGELDDFPSCDIVLLDAPLSQDGKRIFTIFLTLWGTQIRSFYFNDTLQASAVPLLLEQTLSVRKAHHLLVFGGFPIHSTRDATEIFSLLHKSDCVVKILFYWNKYDCGVAQALANYMRDSSNTFYLFLALYTSTERDSTSRGLSQSSFASICDGIAESSCLTSICVQGNLLDENDVHGNDAVESFSRAVAMSTSLEKIVIQKDRSNNFTLRNICNALLGTPQVKNFDLCFKLVPIDNDCSSLTLNRKAPWRLLLAKNVCLSLWPQILTKTAIWNAHSSHTSLDALYFLVREKHDVLLQNVKRRRIRKRKRYGIDV